jgi:hypothetical protein
MSPRGWAIALFGILACQSYRISDKLSPGRSVQPGFTDSERGFIRADSELFDAVVRAQLAGNAKDYPYHLDSLWYDARPYGTDSGYPPYPLHFEKEDSTFPISARAEVIRQLVENRKRVLNALRVSEGPRGNDRQCAGSLVISAPPRGKTQSELLAKCPKTLESYLRVSLPIRGEPPSFRKRPRGQIQLGDLAPLGGEVWTAIVEASHAGPGGGMWEEHGWVFQRDTASGRLKLARTTLLMIAE